MIRFLKTERLLLIVVIGMLFFNIFTKRCSKTIIEKPKTTIIRDTIWQTKIDTFKVQTIKYETVYVPKNNVTKIIRDTIKIKDKEGLIKANIYQDTLSNVDIDIFSYNLVDGKLLDSKITYKLKIPKEILTTKIIETPKTFRSGLYFFSEIGGNTQQFSNLSFGLQYNRKGNWFISYRLNVNELFPTTHNIGVGFRLF